MKKQPRKLQLDKITIQPLTPEGLHRVVGGTHTTAKSWTWTYDVACQRQ